MATTPQDETPAPSPGHTLLTRIAGAWHVPDGRATLLGGAAAAVLLALVFWRNLIHFGLSWATDENYSHGFLVPLISLYFANQAASRPGPARSEGGAGLGTALLVGALLVKLGTVVVSVGTLGDLALVAAIAGICTLLGGTEALWRYGFAIGFLLFMIPMPVALYALIASPLQLAVSRLASVLLNATGVPILTEGNMMTLPGGVQMFVAEACSGMRQLTGFLALTAAVAHLSGRPLWYRGGVVLSAVPVAMTANVARVVLTGYIMYYVSPTYASGTFHTLEGLLMLGFGLALLRGLCGALDLVVELTRPPKEPEPPTPPVAAPRGGAIGVVRPSRRVEEVTVGPGGGVR